MCVLRLPGRECPELKDTAQRSAQVSKTAVGRKRCEHGSHRAALERENAVAH